MTKWKTRYELPVIKKLDIKFDIERIKKEFEIYERDKIWDAFETDYVNMSNSYALPKMFFKDEELEGVDELVELDWEKSSYRQLSLTEYEPSYSLDQRVEKSGTNWDTRIAKHNTKADERWFRKIKKDVPSYLEEILNYFDGKAHRSRFARLAPHSEIKPHVDYDTIYGVRLHMAIETNELCFNGGWDENEKEFKFHIPADGHVWFINTGVKHFAFNNGDTPRIHLVMSVDSQNILH